MAMNRILPGVLAAAALACPVFAQPPAAPRAAATAAPVEITPYRAVTTEKASLRCGEGDFFYKVGEVASGVTLMVDGESGPWARVAYPANLQAYVKAEDVDVQAGIAKLTRPSRLLAINLAAPQSSWKVLLPTALPVNTTLKVVEPLKDGNDGPIVGYRITPPDQARAYIESRVLRKMTEGEAAKPAATPATTKAPPTTPAPAAPPPATAAPAPGEAAPAQPPVNLAEPMVKPADGTPPPVTISQTPAANPTVPADAPAATPTEPPAAAPARVVSDWTTLDRTFKNMWKQPVLEAELDELLVEHQRALDKADPNDERLHAQIQRRIDALEMRIALRNDLRAQAEARAALDSNKNAVAEQLAIAERARVYTIVGQLQPSTVYDGQKLPLMYRIVSAGAAAPKTLGYLKDDPQFQLKGKIGAVLGVIGDAQLDRSLMLNIITPVRVDTLRPSGETGGMNTPPAPTPAPTTPTTPTTAPPPAAAAAPSSGG